MAKSSGDGSSRLPREVVGSLSLEVSKSCGDVAPRDPVSEHSGDALWVGLVILVVFSNVNDPGSMYGEALTGWKFQL